MDYNTLLKPPLLEIYTYTQPDHDEKCFVELYGKERYISKTLIDDEINVDKNITHLKVTLSDEQQTTSTTDLLTTDRKNEIYSKIRTIIIPSQMTKRPMEMDQRSSLICSDLIKFIPDLSKITTLFFNTDLSIHAVNPSTTLARRLLSKMPKINTLRLSYSYLFRLIESPLIVQILRKQIIGLSIQFYNHLPVPEDMIRIGNIFSSKLNLLYFEIHFNLLIADVNRILPLLFSEQWRNLHIFRFKLAKSQQQVIQRFPYVFKQSLTNYFNAEINGRRNISKIMEYKITDNEFSISF